MVDLHIYFWKYPHRKEEMMKKKQHDNNNSGARLLKLKSK